MERRASAISQVRDETTHHFSASPSSDKEPKYRYPWGMQHFLVFGNHPRLSLAEFRCVKDRLLPPIICGNAAIVQDEAWNGELLMNRLGGTVKLGDIIGNLPLETLDAEAILEVVRTYLPPHSFDFGMSLFGGGRGAKNRFHKLPIQLKKAFKHAGFSTRWVSGEHGSELSPAAVAKLKLTTHGLDLCLFAHGETIFIGKTSDVQAADAWSLRDYGRPARDDRNGMLPPKLARMMVNLANIPHQGTVLDPFCGGGTVAMEVALASDAKHIISSDVEDKQIADTLQNLAWLEEERILRTEDAGRFHTFQSDARNIGSHLPSEQVDAIITEGYLGPPLRGHERLEDIERNARAVEKLWADSLRAFYPLLSTHGRIVGIWPAYKTSQGMARVDLTDQLSFLGFRLVEPLTDWEPSHGPLLYMRPDQHVARRIVILEKTSRS